jgi:formylglycine-generating enzyme required for sulfatase activity
VDGRRFCAWLSKKEGRTYRLPTSSEWTAAAGVDKYPWGNSFPPSGRDGNYAGTELVPKPSAWTIPGHSDGFPRTSPVGSFPPNRNGLYDMGGNVWQWCEDEYKTSMNTPDALGRFPFLRDEKVNGVTCRVTRGGAWGDFTEMYLRSSFYAPAHPLVRRSDCGFRCVLEVPDK